MRTVPLVLPFFFLIYIATLDTIVVFQSGLDFNYLISFVLVPYMRFFWALGPARSNIRRFTESTVIELELAI